MPDDPAVTRAELLAVVERSPAAAGSHERGDWVGLFGTNGVVEDPVGSRPHRGPAALERFYDTFIGPRDITPGYTGDAIGGTTYWGASLEFQIPLYFIPKEIGLKAAVFADAGSIWDYKGPTFYPATGETMVFRDDKTVRSSVGAGLIWDSPFGPMRFDYSIPITKQPYDRVQEFRFGGGTKF